MTLTSAAAVRFQAPVDGEGIGRIVLDRPDDAVNAINLEMIDQLQIAIRAARTTDGLRGLIVTSGKADQWVAGADLKLLTSATASSQVEAAARRFQAVLDELAWLPCTTVAAINGPALGGGLELALACDYRVAADLPGVALGQPEVNLGLVPGGGGTQRLPRLLGLPRALDLILSGRRLNARRAQRAGLLDEVVHPTVLVQAAEAWAQRPKRPLQRPLHLRPDVQTAIDVAELTPAGRRLLLERARRSVLQRTHGHYPAPLRALQAVEVGLARGMAAGLDAEARAFGELAMTPTARHLIWLFGATQHQRRRIATAEARTVERLAVVGAGFMGAAIAEVGATSGLTVRLRDVRPAAVATGLASIRRGVSRRRLDEPQKRSITRRVSGTTDYAGFERADLVIEAVFEDLALKRRVIGELEATIGPAAVIASNTSALPIAEIAAQATHPERIVGMHFFSPAQRMPLLEVVRPAAAADWAVATAVRAGVTLGKTVIVVGDGPGFYTSRVLAVMLNEAALLLEEGASIEDVDRALAAYGFPVGPFVLMDEVGLEVAQHVGETVGRAFGERVPASRLVPQLVEAGQVGRRTGAGFYRWTTPSLVRRLARRPNRVPNPAVQRLLGAAPTRSLGAEAIQERLVLLFINEAIRCLDEGVVRSPVDADLGAVLGLGFPPFLGGPLHEADRLGLATLEGRLGRLAERCGPRYAPAALLVNKARRGESFYPKEP